ncbi:hypothetical protein RHMOL_Rhmol13G0291100 [Rhododendron molle]|uniref:Uncharacterized protein n=1 Tax=Rhododendron molle TaxID=49168 RepID=A0ACC0LDI4_RHOML|nr:hypothetical protein RHMOL_Rhmol13G0291100 [Rhododendron molle]
MTWLRLFLVQTIVHLEAHLYENVAHGKMVIRKGCKKARKFIPTGQQKIGKSLMSRYNVLSPDNHPGFWSTKLQVPQVSSRN